MTGRLHKKKIETRLRSFHVRGDGLRGAGGGGGGVYSSYPLFVRQDAFRETVRRERDDDCREDETFERLREGARARDGEIALDYERSFEGASLCIVRVTWVMRGTTTQPTTEPKTQKTEYWSKNPRAAAMLIFRFAALFRSGRGAFARDTAFIVTALRGRCVEERSALAHGNETR